MAVIISGRVGGGGVLTSGLSLDRGIERDIHAYIHIYIYV